MVSEIRSAKYKLQNDITNLINAFELATGTNVVDVQLEHKFNIDGNVRAVFAKVQVEIR